MKVCLLCNHFCYITLRHGQWKKNTKGNRMCHHACNVCLEQHFLAYMTWQKVECGHRRQWTRDTNINKIFLLTRRLMYFGLSCMEVNLLTCQLAKWSTQWKWSQLTLMSQVTHLSTCDHFQLHQQYVFDTYNVETDECLHLSTECANWLVGKMTFCVSELVHRQVSMLTSGNEPVIWHL